MEITTYRWGVAEQVEVDLSSIFAFPQGIVGFEGLRRFALIEDTESAVCWLQSIEDPATAFAALDAFLIDEAYDIELSEGDAAGLGLTSGADAIVLALLTVRLEPEEYITANLLAPLVLNRRNATGRQVILQDSGYSLQHRIRPEVLAYAA
jgi:flagellar assembly factor FliW